MNKCLYIYISFEHNKSSDLGHVGVLIGVDLGHVLEKAGVRRPVVLPVLREQVGSLRRPKKLLSLKN